MAAPRDPRPSIRMRAVRAGGIVGVLAAACAMSPAVTVQNLRGRKIVDVNRPTMATEIHAGRRVFRIDRDMVENGPAGFSLAIEIEDSGGDPAVATDVEYVLPNDAVKVFFVVSGDNGRPFWSRTASGDLRVREWGARALVSVNLDFLGQTIDKNMKLPIYTWESRDNRIGITGSFETK